MTFFIRTGQAIIGFIAFAIIMILALVLASAILIVLAILYLYYRLIGKREGFNKHVSFFQSKTHDMKQKHQARQNKGRVVDAEYDIITPDSPELPPTNGDNRT